MAVITRENLVWLSVYLAALLAMTWGLVQARRVALATLGTLQAKGDWQDWREAATELSAGQGPVLRRVPTGEEPPELVLLRDHFATSWLILAVLSSVLLATLIVMVRGVVLGPKFEPLRDD